MAGGLILFGTLLGLASGITAGVMTGSFLVGLAIYSGAGVLSVLLLVTFIALRPDSEEPAKVAIPAE